jgi:class 3 adenylate cyclase/tetratricopeptide (TPR) repeat protein
VPDDILASFVPKILHEDLLRRGALPTRPTAQPLRAAVLFADVTGFTATTEALATRGPEGAELVTDYIERVFTPLLDTIATHGGDVLGFAGDSITSIWRADEDVDLVERIALAASCALQMEERVGGMREPSGPVQLTVAVAAGEGSMLQLGGHRDRWKYVVSGPAFLQVERAHHRANPGEVIVSDEATERAGSRLQWTPRGPDDNLLVALVGSPSLPPATNATIEASALIEAYVPEPVLGGFDRGELRIVSAMFIKLPGLDVTLERDRDALNGAVTAIQHALDRYAGSFLRLAADDKGLGIAAAFGLPPHAYEEDAARAAQTALEIEGELRAMRIEYGVGIATGPAYCGTYGSHVHREFTPMGSVMNIAARLMQASQNAITTDEATMRATHGRIRFSELPPVEAKGIDTPVTAFRPLWEEDLTRRSLAVLAEHARVRIVGRQAELGMLGDQLDRLRAGSSSAVVLEGEPGIGKSILLADLIARAADSGVQALFGTGDAVERNTPYHAWNPVFERLLDLEEVVDSGARQTQVLKRLQEWPDGVQLAPLLNALVDVGFAENDTTRALTGGARRDGIHDLAIALLAGAAAAAPVLLVIDDVHWMDSASWELLRRVRRNVHPLMLVTASWPSERSAELTELVAEPDATLVPVGPLPPDQAVDLVADKLGVRELPPQLATLINEKAEGHPYFAEEIAYTLRDEGAIEIEGDRATLRVDVDPDSAFDVPDTIHGVITSRLSRLAPDEGRTLKVASVIGPRFNPDVLRIVHPDHPSPSGVQDQLTHLAELGLITIEPDGSAAFKHSIIWSVAYDMSERRRSIHESVAAWYEANHGSEDWAFSVIAHHWEGAEQPSRALPYLERAGSSALDQGASQDAEHFFLRVIEIGSRQEVEAGRIAHWWTQLGQARAEMGELIGAEEAYYQALDRLGVPVPRSTVPRLVRLFWESLIQIGHLMSLSRTIKDPTEAVRTAQAARVCSLIGELYYFTADQVGFPLLNLMSINRAERSGRHASAGLGYSSLSYLVGVMRLHWLEARYHEQARYGEATAGEAAADVQWIVPLGPAHRVAAANSHASYLMGFSHWDDAFRALDEGIEAARKLRDFYTLEIGQTLRAVGSLLVSPLADAASDVADVLASARERSNVQHEAWALGLQGVVDLRRGDAEAALRAGDAARPLVNDELDPGSFIDPTTVPIYHGVRSVARSRVGDVDEALDGVERTLDALGLAPVFANIPAYQTALEAVFSLREAAGVDQARLAKLTRRALRMLHRFAILFPFAKPTYALYRGRYHLERGRRGRARRLFRRGLRRALASGQSWDEARLHRWMAETSPPDGRREDLAAATLLFERLGGSDDLEGLAQS